MHSHFSKIGEILWTYFPYTSSALYPVILNEVKNLFPNHAKTLQHFPAGHNLKGTVTLMQNSIPSARRAAVDILLRIQREEGFSGQTLDIALSGVCAGMSVADKSLTTLLVYGVISRRLTLDHIIRAHCKKGFNRLHPTVLELLRTGCYQLLYMDKIPPSAAVNEAVSLARAMKQEHAAGFVNAVLRAIDRNRDSLRTFPDLSIQTSCPSELISLWKSAYGDETAAAIARSGLESPHAIVRVNTLVTTPDEFEKILVENGVPYTKKAELPACFEILQGNLLKNLANCSKNCYYLQDAASQLCCAALSPRSGDRVADVCAAPGGKTLTCAGMMGQGYILASDIHAGKCDAMRTRFAELGAEFADVICRDASAEWPEHLYGSFDRVLCDAPCSGFGVIRRKPEIKYKPVSSFSGLPATQRRILAQSAKLVADGGFLQYSTCTLNPAENDDIAEWFLRNHPNFAPRILPVEEQFAALSVPPSHSITLFPHIHGTDGFFIAGFVKLPKTE